MRIANSVRGNHYMKMIFLLLLFVVASEAFGQDATIDWACFPVECEAFFEETLGNYATFGAFDGIGMMYFSPGKKVIEFKGLRMIEFPYMGQESDDKYELKFELFAITAIKSIGKYEYTFQATNGGPFPRTATGKIRFSLTKSGLFGHVEDFQMDEHGQTLRGVMNRYYLPKTTLAKALFKKHEDVFFGGYYVALEFVK